MRTPNIIRSAMLAMSAMVGISSRETSVVSKVPSPPQNRGFIPYVAQPSPRIFGILSSYDHTTNQRKIRKRRRKLHAAGFKNAFQTK